MFYTKTTHLWSAHANFENIDILIIFVMQKEFVKRISIWEKVSDFLMDISKYVLTAVIITSAFEELADVRWMMYVVGVAGAVILLLFSILVMNYINKRNK